MALIKCEDCGKEYSDKAEKCPECSCPNPNFKKEEDVVTKEITIVPKGYWSAGRLSIGIISIILFIIISFQSCTAGLSNALAENDSASGSMGLLLAIGMLVGGIVGICTRNSKSKVGCIISSIFYLFPSLLARTEFKSFPDLKVWSTLSTIFGIVFIICAIKTKKNK